jgi:hypothetical protein
MNARNGWLPAVLLLACASAMAQPVMPSSAPSAIDHPRQTPPGAYEPPGGPQSAQPMDSSGGYRAPTQSGLEQRPGMPQSTTVSALTPKTENGVSYLCGGIGQDEAAQMKQAARDHGLMLTFAARNGSYLADVNVDITDASGNTVLRTTCDGPIMLVDLPKAGNYRIRAEAGGYTLTRTARVAPAGHAKSLVMAWPQQAVEAESPATMTGGGMQRGESGAR